MSGFFSAQTETVEREPEDVTEFRQQTVQPFQRGVMQQPFNPQANPFARFLQGPAPEQRALQASLDPLSTLLGTQLGGQFGSLQSRLGPQPTSPAQALQGQMAQQFLSGAPFQTPTREDIAGRLNQQIDSPIDFAPEDVDIESRQFGGPLEQGQPAIVGEQGPEMFVPQQDGQVIPNPQTQAQMPVTNMGAGPGDIAQALQNQQQTQQQSQSPPTTDVGGGQIDTTGLVQGGGTAAGNGQQSLAEIARTGLQDVMNQATAAGFGGGSGSFSSSPAFSGDPQQLAQQAIEANQPVFQENLNDAIGEFQSQVPSNLNAAAGVGTQELSRRALQDFNAFQAQQRAQAMDQILRGQQIQGNLALGRGRLGLGRGRLALDRAQTAQQGVLGGLGLLGQLAGGAGQGQRAQQQQFINPTMQNMIQAQQMAQPIPPQVTQGASPFSQIAGPVAGVLPFTGAFDGNNQRTT